MQWHSFHNIFNENRSDYAKVFFTLNKYLFTFVKEDWLNLFFTKCNSYISGHQLYGILETGMKTEGKIKKKRNRRSAHVSGFSSFLF